ncbi:pupal cuticle protein Edg-78E [Drosophila bipectinata]|uniref:pupal cuticle protein Edg-78E n=1 Tax=Drosophila bipectinata TaxID=42026 RepID=UPI001C8B0A48|nr:pupal cuticle protein Edg-78E [Drosophila bipectinata]
MMSPSSRSFCKILLVVTLGCLHFCIGIARDSAARTIYYRNIPPDSLGLYSFEFQTTNGITTKGAGNENGAVGVVQYVSPEGIPVTFSYVADANGYQPTGDMIPTIPLHVIRQLEYIRTHSPVDERRSRRW